MELLAPVGNWEMLSAALNAGADAVYFGVRGLNMRARARNFTLPDIGKLAKLCHSRGARAYLALNTIVFDDELEQVGRILDAAKESGVDAVIAWDLAVISRAQKLGISVHLSTQASAANTSAVKSWSKLGVDRVVLARECNLDEIKNIIANTSVEIEVFGHGAMCVSVSGRCFMSEHLYGKSANKGECIQPCRRQYEIRDPETGKELVLDHHYVMSPRDLCTIEFIDKLLNAGVDCLKIEGRNRSPEYVKTAVECYKEAMELTSSGNYNALAKKRLLKRLASVYNRGFSNGFYMGRPIGDWTDDYGSKSTLVKEYVGYVENYFRKAGAAQVRIETGKLSVGDNVLVIGPTTGCAQSKVKSMQIDGKAVKSIQKGKSAGVSLPLVRKNDKVYLLKKRSA